MDDEQSKDGLENAITAYYGAAADGDYQYTYDNLVSEDSAQLSVDEWFTANEALASDQGSYDLIQISEPFPDGHYEAINNVSGDDRLTKWFYQDGGWRHALTGEEIDMFISALESSASASASASAAPVDSGGTGEVEVTVESSEPVDVMILAVNDPDAPIINEQVTFETFSLSMDEGSGLSASAQTQDIMSETEVSVRVYENGQLVAEDQSPGMALVQY